MPNRKLAYIVKDRMPLKVSGDATVQHCCHLMRDRRAGSVLVVDVADRLQGIFTGRDAVRLLAQGHGGAAMLASDAMTTNPFTLAPESRAIDAIRAMLAGHFRHVPVVENGRVVGVVSRGDFTGMEFEEFNWERAGQTADDLANRALASIIEDQKPFATGGEQRVADACREMHARGCGSALVVDQHGRLCGIFTGRDAVELLARDPRAPEVKLNAAMKCDPLTLSPDRRAIDALRTMSDGGFRHIPVVDGGRLIGVVSRRDFTGLEIDRLDEEEHLAECIW